jgi:hypothetical protein
MFKSFFKKLLFNFDQLSYLVTGNYDDIASNFSNDELYNFTLDSQNRCDEIKYFLQSNFGNDYYFKEFNREISALINNFNIKSIDANYISSFQKISTYTHRNVIGCMKKKENRRMIFNSLIFDKSTFQGMSPEEIFFLQPHNDLSTHLLHVQSHIVFLL